MKFKFSIGDLNIADTTKGIEMSLGGIELEVEATPAECIEGGKQALDALKTMIPLIRDHAERDYRSRMHEINERTRARARARNRY